MHSCRLLVFGAILHALCITAIYLLAEHPDLRDFDFLVRVALTSFLGPFVLAAAIPIYLVFRSRPILEFASIASILSGPLVLLMFIFFAFSSTRYELMLALASLHLVEVRFYFIVMSIVGVLLMAKSAFNNWTA